MQCAYQLAFKSYTVRTVGSSRLRLASKDTTISCMLLT